MIKGINHISISTTDFDRALVFYRDLLGMEALKIGEFGASREMNNITGLEQASGKGAMLSLGSMYLELFEYSNPPPRKNDPIRPCDSGITHICFEATDIEAEYKRLKTAGVNFHCAPQTINGTKATYGRDPDGNIFELLEIPETTKTTPKG